MLYSLDWVIVVGFLALFVGFGLWSSKSQGETASSFFLSGRNMPWWLLGVSMVATTFSSDTPNLVSDIVRKNGIAGNWQWWAFLITGMITAFVFSILWRRSQVFTDLEFYEIRYGGKPASFLRGFRAIYLGGFFNIMIMASTTLAAIKIGSVIFDVSSVYVVLLGGGITLLYSSLGGIKSVIITDALQFIVAMIGSIGAAFYVLTLPEVGGIEGILSNPDVSAKINFFPDFDDKRTLISLLIIPLAVQWWSVWYPGAEPGGGGYVAQRILASKNENHALKATLFFNIAHYALRPWPWIIVALGSIAVYPTIESLKVAFPSIDPSIIIDDDLAYSAMIRLLPTGLLGIVVGSLMAAYMSTLSTHLNWGSSYIVYDFYKQFVKPDASEKKLVLVGRISSVILMSVQAVVAFFVESALQAFSILLSIGAGTGLIFMLRWFWWRINAYTEISGMVISFLIALVLFFGDFPLREEYKMLVSVGITTVGWVLITFLTPPVPDHILVKFYHKVRPYGLGWKYLQKRYKLNSSVEASHMPHQVLKVFLGVFSVYFFLFGVGYVVFGKFVLGGVLLAIGLCLFWWMISRIKKDVL